MIKRRRLKKWVKIALVIMIIMTLGFKITLNNNEKNTEIAFEMIETKENLVEKAQKKVENTSKIAENLEKTEKIEVKVAESELKVEEKKPEVVENPIYEPIEVVKGGNSYRMTSYYPYESSNCTGSGKCTGDFQVNDKGWYLYDGKIVLAAATTYLQKNYGTINGRHYFKYYDEIDITIDGTTYKGIILDSCGACMSITHEERIDLFVSSSNYVIDRGYKGNNMVEIKW